MKTANPTFNHISTKDSSLHDEEALTGFLARGIQSLNAAAKNNDYVDADEVVAELRQRLKIARTQA
jgi:hypothetical protein